MRTLLYGRLFNEWYAKDTSKKIRAVIRSKGMSGQRTSNTVPYGYLKGEDGKLMVDEETAPVVQLIFQLCAEGSGPGKIARTLREREIATPTTLAFRRTGQAYRYDPDHPCHWSENSISNILAHKEYLGHTVNFKTTKKSFKSKKTIENPEDLQVVFEHTHEAIIEQETWELVQKNRQQRHRPTRQDEVALFSGMVFCADCGNKLFLHRAASMPAEKESYACGTYKRKKGECTAHFIRAVVLERLVLDDVREVFDYINGYEDDFVRQVTENKLAARMETQAESKRLLEQQARRITEIDAVINRLYEDNISGKLSDERFAKMSITYEQEQKALEASTVDLRKAVEACKQQKNNIQSFLKIVHSYTKPDVLTPAILHELVNKIIVHAPDKSSGHRTQQVDIFYNFVDRIERPDVITFPTVGEETETA